MAGTLWVIIVFYFNSIWAQELFVFLNQPVICLQNPWGFARISENKFPPGQADQAVNLSLSTGRLIFPKEYVNYKQTNINLMLELSGQHLIGENENFLDLAPAVQFIFNSQTRLDIGYKVQFYSDMQRVAPNGFMIRVEHLLFNVF
jgi:hypothetical protein